MSLDIAREVLDAEADAIRRVAERLDQRFVQAVDAILACRGRIVVSGMGKSGIICKKLAATFASTGTPAFFLHPAEARHGDLGMIVPGDLVIVASASGKTVEILRLLEFLKRVDVKIIGLIGDQESTLAGAADICLDVSVPREACRMNLAPTASTTATLAMGDALAVAVYTRRSFKPDDFARIHPGGELGFKLVKVRDIMKTGDDMPCVPPDATIQDAVQEMSRKRLGMTTVVAAGGQLKGILTDGDLRRLVEAGTDLAKASISDHATPRPSLIGADEPASKALSIMEKHQRTHLLVTNSDERLIGVVHIHDLWRLQMF